MFESKKRLYIFGCTAVGILGILLLYFGLIVSGAINLTQNNLVISSGSVSRVYDGETLMNHDYELQYGKVKDDETLEVVFTKTISEIGTVQNEFFVIIRDENSNIVTSKYDIEYIFGELTISPVPLNIITATSSKTYDGESLSNESWDLLSGTLLEGHTLKVNVIGEITEVGSVENDFVTTIVDENNKEFTHLYAINKTCGTLSITGKRISIYTDSNYKQYDGKELVEEGYSYDESTLLNGHTIAIKTTGSLTEVGSTNNTFSCFISDRYGNDVTSQYIISAMYGTLTIDKKDIIISTHSESKQYDGTPLTEEGYDIVGLLDGHKEDVTNIGSLTDVSTNDYFNTCVFSVYDESGKDVTTNYNASYNYGTLTITPYVVTVYSNDVRYTYSGESFSDSLYEISKSTPLINGDVEDIDKLTYFVIPGTHQNLISFKFYNKDSKDVSNNYEVDNKLGNIIIEQISLKIISKDYKEEFDGIGYNGANDVESDYIVYGYLILDHRFVFDNKTQIVNVGTTENNFSVTIYDGQNNDITKYYDIECISGALEVTSKEIYLYSAKLNFTFDNSTYDADELYKKGQNYYTIYDTLLDGYRVDNVKFYGDIKNVGTIENICYVDIIDLEGSKTTNYTVVYKYEYITITKANLTITTGSNAFEYVDGTYYSNETYSYSGSLYDDVYFTLTGFKAYSEIGCYFNVATVNIIDKETNLTSDNYDYKITFGNITIYEDDYPINLRPTADYVNSSDLATYVHSNYLNGFEYFENVLGYSYIANVLYYESNGEYFLYIDSVSLFDENGEPVDNKFKIQYSESTLTVYDTIISISSDGSTRSYNGEALIEDENDIKISGLPAGYSYSLNLLGGQTTVGTSRMSYTIVIYDENKIDVTNKFYVQNELGYLTITKAVITVNIEDVIVTEAVLAKDIILKYTCTDIDSKFVLDVLNVSDGNVTKYEMALLVTECNIYLNGENVTRNFTINVNEATAKF